MRSGSSSRKAVTPEKHPLFDGNRAWRHLHEKLGMAATPLQEMDARKVERFWRWAEGFKDVLGIQKGPVVLTAPLWGF